MLSTNPSARDGFANVNEIAFACALQSWASGAMPSTSFGCRSPSVGRRRSSRCSACRIGHQVGDLMVRRVHVLHALRRPRPTPRRRRERGERAPTPRPSGIRRGCSRGGVVRGRPAPCSCSCSDRGTGTGERRVREPRGLDRHRRRTVAARARSRRSRRRRERLPGASCSSSTRSGRRRRRAATNVTNARHAGPPGPRVRAAAPASGLLGKEGRPLPPPESGRTGTPSGSCRRS